MTRPRSNLIALLVSTSILCGCPATTPPPATPKTADKAPAETRAESRTAPASQPKPRIDGEIQSRRMKIWGEVQVILKSKHAKLPPLERKPTESTRPPYTTIYNDTPHAMTVWLAGPCVKKLQIPSGGEASAEICAGRYAVAAKVETAAFLPLVREDQDFAVGIRYTLRIQIKQKPTTTRKRRWVR